MKHTVVPCPGWEGKEVEGGTASIVWLNPDEINPHHLYFMKRKFDMITKEMLDVSKGIQEVKTDAKMLTVDQNKPCPELSKVVNLLEEAENLYDRWMMEQEEEV